MRGRPRKPPPAIVQAHALEYAVLPRSIPFAGDSSIFVGKAGGPLLPLERVPRLAICRDPDGIRLTFCGGRWQYVASTHHKTVAEAKKRAERIYPGSLRYWAKTGFTAADVRSYLERVWGRHRCMFCLKTPLEFDRSGTLFRMGRGRICSSCVMEFTKNLAKNGHGA
jgi:hypothetical protein